MQNSKLNEKICAICGKVLIILGIEDKIRRNHQDKMEHGLQDYGAEIQVSDFKSDQHLGCRIKCAKYYKVGLGSRWFTREPFGITNNNVIAYEVIQKIKQMNYQKMRRNGVYLYGLPGLGKTHLLANLCRGLIDRNVRINDITWENTPTLLTKIRSSFGKKYEYGEETIQEKLLERLKVKHLFLDDLGTESASEWAKETLYEAVNYRYEERLPTFVSSNLSLQELAEKIGDKFASRIVEMCNPLKVTGEDMRLQRGPLDEKAQNIVIPEFSYQMAYWNIK